MLLPLEVGREALHEGVDLLLILNLVTLFTLLLIRLADLRRSCQTLLLLPDPDELARRQVDDPQHR